MTDLTAFGDKIAEITGCRLAAEDLAGVAAALRPVAGNTRDGVEGLVECLQVDVIPLGPSRPHLVPLPNLRARAVAALKAQAAENARLREQVEGLEQLRPAWAQGYSADSVAAQAFAGAATGMWKLLGSTNQTEAMERLRGLIEAEKKASRLRERIAVMDAALEPFSDIADLIESETEGMSKTDELKLLFHDYLFASWPVQHFRAARAARTNGGSNGE